MYVDREKGGPEEEHTDEVDPSNLLKYLYT